MTEVDKNDDLEDEYRSILGESRGVRSGNPLDL